MISKLSFFLTSVLLQHTVSDETEKYREVFQYVFFIILNYICFFAYSLILGALLGIPLQGIVFFISLVFLRRYAGGYHADTESACLLISTSYLTVGLILIKLVHTDILRLNTAYLAALMICSIVIILLSPCDTPEKPLEQKQIRIMKIKTVITVFIILAVTALIWFFDKQILCSPFIFGIFIETALLIAGRIKYRKIKRKHNTDV